MRIRRNTLLLMLLAATLILSACGAAGNQAQANKTYTVAPRFREFYSTLGGEEVLGPAISDTVSVQSYDCQFTVSALMCLNPMVSDASRFLLYPLGNSMNVKEDPAQAAAQSGSQVINGYTIDDGFLALYNKLSGARFTGSPLTPGNINYQQKRYELLRNVGFYRNLARPCAAHLWPMAPLAARCPLDTPSVDAIILNATKPNLTNPC